MVVRGVGEGSCRAGRLAGDIDGLAGRGTWSKWTWSASQQQTLSGTSALAGRGDGYECGLD